MNHENLLTEDQVWTTLQTNLINIISQYYDNMEYNFVVYNRWIFNIFSREKIILFPYYLFLHE